ncbi:MAG: AsnC family transcriptional regulator [Thermofilum sp. ex4484_15]|nr:MAG: AsnC family transcriptional regulator [Thermofilum sp. ex4484_15]
MTMAFVLISTEMGSERKVLEELKKIDEVSEAYIVYGVYDIVAKIEVRDVDELKNIVSNKIRAIDYVRSTLTMIGAEGFRK